MKVLEGGFLIMKKLGWTTLLTIFVSLISLYAFIYLFSQSATAGILTEEERTMQLVETLPSSIVIIRTDTHLGTGFYVSKDWVITDYHVVKNEKISLETDKGKVCDANLIYEDHEKDLALLQTNCDGVPLKLATTAKLGQTVLQMGHPEGEYYFLTKGIVSSLLRKGFISTDARTIEGNSGSPIVNLEGEVVGVARWVFKVSEKVAVATDYTSLNAFLEMKKYVDNEEKINE
jgi:S1-C subfamily serine protease